MRGNLPGLGDKATPSTSRQSELLFTIHGEGRKARKLAGTQRFEFETTLWGTSRKREAGWVNYRPRHNLKLQRQQTTKRADTDYTLLAKT